jgi:hypothetical protein
LNFAILILNFPLPRTQAIISASNPIFAREQFVCGTNRLPILHELKSGRSMMSKVDLERLTPAEQIVGEDAEETALLNEMLQNAIDYLRGFRWCPPIDQVYMGCGVGGVVAVFLFHFREQIHGTDEWLWVIEGDLPTAYLVLDQASDPASALEVYCCLMEDWAKAVIKGRPLKEVFPVQAEPSLDNANILLERLTFIRTRLLPNWKRDEV